MLVKQACQGRKRTGEREVEGLAYMREEGGWPSKEREGSGGTDGKEQMNGWGGEGEGEGGVERGREEGD